MVPENTNILTPEDTLTIKEMVDEFVSRQETKVISYNVKKQVKEESVVVSTRRSTTHDLYYIETDYDEVKVLVTHDQRIYIKNQSAFYRPERIKINDQLLHADGIDVNVVKVHKIKNTLSDQVYTLIVDNNYNFFANDILIHNND
jgi:hypothetical protein